MLSYPNDVVSGLFEQAEHVCLPDSALRSVTASRLRDWWWREAACCAEGEEAKELPIPR